MSALDEIKARAEAATPGPWFLDAGGDTGVYTEARASMTSRDVASAFRREDEKFIASAREDVPRLVAALENVQERAAFWASQPTDYDADTEQQIEDGRAILAEIEKALEGTR